MNPLYESSTRFLPGLFTVAVSLGAMRYLPQTPAIPSGPAWAVAITIFITGLAILGNVVVKIIRAAKPNGRLGSRGSDDHPVDRTQLKEDIITSGLVLQTHSMLERWVQTGGQMKDLLQKMTDSLTAAQRHSELHTGLLDICIKNQGALEVAFAKIGERLEHMPTTAEMLEDGRRNRHALRNDATALAAGEKLPP